MRNVKTPIRSAGLLAAALLAAPAQAQIRMAGPRPQPTYGTADRITYQVNAFDLEPAASSVEMGITFPGLRYISSAPGSSAALYSGLRLPAGALLDFVTIFGCDDDVDDDIVAGVYACADPAGACNLVGETSTAGASGCVSAGGSLGGATVDNFQTYFLQVQMGVGITDTLRSVKLEYRLQVSPDPAIQSFTDVPIGHPFHQFVEALYAAGVTAGYPDGRFGVDDPITRGQMAVFLSLALGLHWPN
jgi:S-layer family protein